MVQSLLQKNWSISTSVDLSSAFGCHLLLQRHTILWAGEDAWIFLSDLEAGNFVVFLGCMIPRHLGVGGFGRKESSGFAVKIHPSWWIWYLGHLEKALKLTFPKKVALSCPKQQRSASFQSPWAVDVTRLEWLWWTRCRCCCAPLEPENEITCELLQFLDSWIYISYIEKCQQIDYMPIYNSTECPTSPIFSTFCWLQALDYTQPPSMKHPHFALGCGLVFSTLLLPSRRFSAVHHRSSQRRRGWWRWLCLHGNFLSWSWTFSSWILRDVDFIQTVTNCNQDHLPHSSRLSSELGCSARPPESSPGSKSMRPWQTGLGIQLNVGHRKCSLNHQEMIDEWMGIVNDW